MRDDPLLDEITRFFEPDEGNTPFLVMSMTPTADLTARGWKLMGHPPIMVRPPSPATPPEPADFEIVPVRDARDLATFNDTIIEAFPMPELRGLRSFGDGLLALSNYRIWLGVLDGQAGRDLRCVAHR